MHQSTFYVHVFSVPRFFMAYNVRQVCSVQTHENYSRKLIFQLNAHGF